MLIGGMPIGAPMGALKGAPIVFSELIGGIPIGAPMGEEMGVGLKSLSKSRFEVCAAEIIKIHNKLYLF